MEIAKTYSPQEAESKWYKYWIENKFFKSVPDQREPYTIVIPPPNVTGVLHMGHMLNNTIQDVLIRRARMLGKNACWVPGTDHASIATEAKVVKMLADKGIKKSDLSREEFLKYAWEWKEKYGGIILDQLKRLGASCDWDRTRFTMEEELSEAVIDVFIDLYNKGQIYRGVRMVNWDPQGQTAVSDEEVIYKESNSKLVYVKYMIKGSNDFIAVATTRPETIMGDTAVCVHPDDERYKKLKGATLIVPIVNREVPLIFDEYIDKEFGTGALKVTPAHDINDFNLGQKHKLPVIDALNPDGTISKAAGAYVGMDRFAARRKIIKDLTEQGLVLKVEEIKNKVGHSERTDAVIEPKLSMQWFLKMDKISKPALDAVLNGEVKLIPEKYINTYKHWMENVHDWCISRQLWWGQRIPAWYDDKGNTVVAKTKEEAISKLRTLNPELRAESVKQDEDVLDTWFSSWLWPLTVFDPAIIRNGWDKANKDLKYYYPTNDLVTAPEILFFWVARMIIAGEEYTGKKPFTNVYLTGIVRDKLGRKMSKSLGNSPDPIELMEMYSADGVRVGVLLPSPAGNDLMFDTPLEITPEAPLISKYCEQGRNFTNKIWNSLRLLKSFQVDVNLKQSSTSEAAIKWFESRFSEQLHIINDHFDKYRMSDALMTTYKLFWDDFCAYYLEAIKPEFVDGKADAIDSKTLDRSIEFLEELMIVIHPWMPFITEEIWDLIKKREGKDRCIVAKWPAVGKVEQNVIGNFEFVQSIIMNIRNFRNSKGLAPKEKLKLVFKGDNSESDILFKNVLIKLANLSEYSASTEAVKNAYPFNVKGYEYFIVSESKFDAAEEKDRLKKELDYNKGFLKSVQVKLANEKFMANAKPELIALEKKKESDALSKISALEEQLKNL